MPLPAPIKAPKKASASTVLEGDEAIDVDEDTDPQDTDLLLPPAPAAPPQPVKRKAPEKKAPPPPKPKEPSSDEESEDDGPAMSLAQRLAAKGGGAKPVAKSSVAVSAGCDASPLPKPTAKRACDKGSPLLLGETSMADAVAPPKRGGARVAAKKKP